MQQLLRAVACLGLVSAFAAAGHASESPITRVVKLLEDITKNIEKETKEEEDLYETFVCWAKSIVSQKTETNEAAQSRADMLTQYIDDLDSGKIELTTERVDLTKDIEELNADMQIAKDNREAEKKDYEGAKEEMETAIEALTSATQVLTTATANHQEGTLIEVDASTDSSAGSRAREAAALSHAAELGKRILTPGDAFFLQRLLTGEVPKPDWKKLNRKADFKNKYKLRSTKIQDVLAKMKETFEDNLKQAIAKEGDAVKLHGELMLAKGKELGTAQTALTSMEKETGARGESKEESVEERDGLLEQVKNDKKWIEQVEKSLADKKVEWKGRKALRTAEAAAVSKAIGILRDDDARDLFKKSSSSFLFLQEGLSTASSARLASNAADALQAAAKQANDNRLSVLAMRIVASSSSHFTEVLKAIDNMIKDLEKEEEDDLVKKENCEANRQKDAREAIKIARAMDELSEAMDTDEAKVKETTGEVTEKEKQIVEIQQELKDAKPIREKENSEFLQAKKDDEDAIVVVNNAKKVLEDFYADNKLTFIQQSVKATAPFESEAGKAPPPPPSTWSEPYRGKTPESTSVVSILGVIADEMTEEIAKAVKDEAAAVALYDKTKLAMEDEIKALNTAIGELNIAKGLKAKAVTDNSNDRGTKRAGLEVVMQRISESQPGCDFFTVNYPLVLKNRHTEIDGLKKAKAILAGGDFSFVQGHLRASRKQSPLALE